MWRELHPAKNPPLEWVLVANAARARCFERDPDNNAMREVADFVHPQGRQKGEALLDDRPGQVHKGVPSTGFDPRTDVHEKERQQFARELAQHLESAALAQRFSSLALFASNPFLGDLRAQLGASTQGRLAVSQALDLTSFSGADLERRVAHALQVVDSRP